MSRSVERIPKRWNISEIPHRNESSSTEESSSLTDSTQYSPYLQNTSTPLKTRWTNLEEIKTRRGQEKFEDIEKASSNKKRLERFQKHRKHIGRRKQDNHERIIEKQKGEHNRHDKRRHEYSKDSVEKKAESDSESSVKNDSESDLEKSKRKKHDFTRDNELPITEILRRSQENTQTKYEEQASLPVLNTDKVYVQYRGGFTTMKMNPSKDQSMSSSNIKKIEKDATIDIIDNQSSSRIKIAIKVQQFWKRAGLLCQGLLAGTALMHFITLCTVFSNSIEFIVKYSTYSEIYTNNFSFLIALCIVATFDKFDLARFDVEHLRELYFDYNKAIIAVPLYLVIFSLHQVCAEIDNKLSLIHYYNSNVSTLQNITNIQSLLDELNNWQKISISKDILAMFAWLFVALGTRDDSFLIYLQSMKKYANDIETSGQ
ncbi:uncharacterized protein LOC105736451 isoform X2 [Apis florea]|uniref:uncharacterized protein LOC105736451 isoform X2 n=1 Tax=Apis florea TaxID=7463 RepID=UPI0006290B18|nr:uncharacterized protein LOC105736451 isoform X2 [Apis florea]